MPRAYYHSGFYLNNHFNPFGMVMPGRSFNAGNYRFGFNGQEKVDEISGNGNHNTALFWEYDTRLGRRWNLDPKPNSGISSYSCFNNNSNLYTDYLGDTTKIFSKAGDFLDQIDDKLKNRVDFISIDKFNKIRDNAQKEKLSRNKYAREIRGNSDYFMGKSTLNKINAIRKGENNQNAEAGFVLTISESRELIATELFTNDRSMHHFNMEDGLTKRSGNYFSYNSNFVGVGHNHPLQPFDATPMSDRLNFYGTPSKPEYSTLTHGWQMSDYSPMLNKSDMHMISSPYGITIHRSGFEGLKRFKANENIISQNYFSH